MQQLDKIESSKACIFRPCFFCLLTGVCLADCGPTDSDEQRWGVLLLWSPDHKNKGSLSCYTLHRNLLYTWHAWQISALTCLGSAVWSWEFSGNAAYANTIFSPSKHIWSLLGAGFSKGWFRESNNLVTALVVAYLVSWLLHRCICKQPLW